VTNRTQAAMAAVAMGMGGPKLAAQRAVLNGGRGA
jgi:hypothetical protein